MDKVVSIIVPVYNVEEYLDECVVSLLNQTYSNIEIILVDDGSTDSSPSICDKYAKKDTRVKVLHKENGGLSDARNKGTEIATGDYYYYVDSDDYLLKETVEELLFSAINNNSDIVFFDAYCFYESDCKGKRIQHYLRKQEYRPSTGKTAFSQMVKNNEYHASVSLIFVKSDFIKKHHIEYSLNTIFVDMIYTYEAFLLAEKVSYINKAYYQRRYRADSLITSKVTPNKFYSANVVYEIVRDFTINNGFIDNNECKQYVVRCASNVLNYFDGMQSVDKKELKKERKAVSNNIMSFDAFDDKALKMKCKSKTHWFIFKVLEKVFRL